MKVGKEIYRVKGELIEVELHYGRKLGFTFKGIPDEVYKMTNTQTGYLNEKALKDATERALFTWHEMIQEKRKVIVYRLFATDTLVRDPNWEPFSRTSSDRRVKVSKKFDSNGGFKTPSFSFGFEHHVYFEVDNNGLKYFGIMEDGTMRSNPEHLDSSCNWNVIDFSEERALFFKGLADNLQNLVYKVSAFFDSPDMLKLMDSNTTKQLM
jgi:hypothetical protein